MLKIAIATQNEGKIREIEGYSHPVQSRIEWITYKQIKDFPQVEETGDTFLDNASLKAEAISRHTQLMVVADDSGLKVDALEGRPGVLSSRFAGDQATDEENRIKLLRELEGIDIAQRGAQFVCSLVLWDPHQGLLFKTEGICPGRIGFVERGQGGFGYDSLFIPDGFTRTMAELSSKEKNNISHRGKALSSFYRFIENF